MATKDPRSEYLNLFQIRRRLLHTKSNYYLPLIELVASELGYTQSDYVVGSAILKGYTLDQAKNIAAAVKTKVKNNFPQGYKSLKHLLLLVYKNNNQSSVKKVMAAARDLNIEISFVRLKTRYGLGFLTQGDYEKVFKKLQEHSSG